MQGGERWKKSELGEIAVADKHISTFFIVGHTCRHRIIHTTDSFYFFSFSFQSSL